MGDKSGRLLAWILRKEQAPPLITSVRNQSGELVYTRAGMLEQFQQHLEKVYMADPSVRAESYTLFLKGLQLRKLSEEAWLELKAQITEEEIVEEIADIPKAKAPGGY